MKKHIITITGLPGSGKSSTADEVARTLNYRRFSSGDLWRQVAHEQHLSVEELNTRAETDKSIDSLVDDAVRRAREKDNIVIDSRLAFHWIPDSYKVFLHIDPHTAAERTFAHMKNVGRVSQMAQSVEEVFEKTAARTESERARYADLYGVDYTKESQYDFVVDTTKHSLDEVAQMIVKAYVQWVQG